jgi:hypothetical protein
MEDLAVPHERIPRVARAAPSKTPDPKRPYHLGMAIGISAGLYAASLATVTTLQVDADRTVIADRQPVRDAIDVLDRHHEELAGRLGAARASYSDATVRYGSVAEGLKAVHDRLVALGTEVAALDRVRVPSLNIPYMPTVKVPGRAPGTAPRPAKAPPPPPPTHASSGASGG